MKPILLIAPPRTGSSVTAEIIQKHIGDWPFEVNEYNEPVELIEIINDWLERVGTTWMIFKENPPIDAALLHKLVIWFDRYEDCVIKEPRLSLINSTLVFSDIYRSVFLTRDLDDAANSLYKHKRKRMSKEFAKETMMWMQDICLPRVDINFSHNYKQDLQNVIERLGLTWDEDIFNSCYKSK